jgi:hypothetical protein
VSEPQVIDDEDHERVWERVAAVDVAKATGMVCTRAPHPSRPILTLAVRLLLYLDLFAHRKTACVAGS